MIKTLLLLLLAIPVSADENITKSHCDEIYEVLTEEVVYIKEQSAREIYERCLTSLN